MLSVYFPDSTQIMHQNQGGEWFNDVMGFGAKYRSFQKPKSFPERYGIYVDENKDVAPTELYSIEVPLFYEDFAPTELYTKIRIDQ